MHNSWNVSFLLWGQWDISCLHIFIDSLPFTWQIRNCEDTKNSTLIIGDFPNTFACEIDPNYSNRNTYIFTNHWKIRRRLDTGDTEFLSYVPAFIPDFIQTRLAKYCPILLDFYKNIIHYNCNNTCLIPTHAITHRPLYIIY